MTETRTQPCFIPTVMLRVLDGVPPTGTLAVMSSWKVQSKAKNFGGQSKHFVLYCVECLRKVNESQVDILILSLTFLLKLSCNEDYVRRTEIFHDAALGLGKSTHDRKIYVLLALRIIESFHMHQVKIVLCKIFTVFSLVDHCDDWIVEALGNVFRCPEYTNEHVESCNKFEFAVLKDFSWYSAWAWGFAVFKSTTGLQSFFLYWSFIQFDYINSKVCEECGINWVLVIK